MHNWWPALRCSSCRAIKDDELQTAIEDTIDVFNESESAIEDAKRLSMRNKLLRQRNQVLLNDNKRLEAENEKLSKWVERLFKKIQDLEEAVRTKEELKEQCDNEKVFDPNQLLLHFVWVVNKESELPKKSKLWDVYYVNRISENRFFTKEWRKDWTKLEREDFIS